MHRVIVGRDYYEPQGIEPQVCLMWLPARLPACLRRAGGSLPTAAAPLKCWRFVAFCVAQETVARAFAFLLKKKVPRATEGVPSWLGLQRGNVRRVPCAVARMPLLLAAHQLLPHPLAPSSLPPGRHAAAVAVQQQLLLDLPGGAGGSLSVAFCLPVGGGASGSGIG